jgi:putative ABC transport system ATP-binding protein
VQALEDVSLEFSPGRLTLIMGPSGSGKTSLLCVLGCLLRPDRGDVLVEGRDVGPLSEAQRTQIRRRHIGFVFQSFRLFHSLSALDNVLLSADINGRRSKWADDAARLLSELGMAAKLSLKPNALSGGEKQRVAIARALLADPGIVLADEPTAALDSRSGQQVSGILLKLAEAQGRTVVVVSHDPRWKQFAHRTVVLEDGRVAVTKEALLQ